MRLGVIGNKDLLEVPDNSPGPNQSVLAQMRTKARGGAGHYPRPDDVSSPEAIVKASFEVESGPLGAPRNWARERTLYDPAGISVATGPEPGTGSLTPNPGSRASLRRLRAGQGFYWPDFDRSNFHGFGAVGTWLASAGGITI